MVDDIRDVVIVGGGISGLTAGWYLHYAGMDVCLVESQTEVGGVTQTQRRDGFLLEKVRSTSSSVIPPLSLSWKVSPMR